MRRHHQRLGLNLRRRAYAALLLLATLVAGWAPLPPSQAGAATRPILEPTLRVEPTRGPCDGDYTVRGYGFGPRERMLLYVRPASRPQNAPLDAFEVVADDSGSLVAAIPPGLLSCLPTIGPDAEEQYELFAPAGQRPGGYDRTVAASFATVPAPGECFPQTGFCVSGRFLRYYQQHGGLATNGYPLSGVFTERLEDGKEYAVQYFERTRLEAHAEAVPPYDVQLGQFGRRIRPADPPTTALPGAIYFPQTGHNLGGRFRDYWETHGGLDQFGYPLSEEFVETLEDGKAYTVQYFERARFEYHPENPAEYRVLLGHFGRRILTEVGGTNAPR